MANPKVPRLGQAVGYFGARLFLHGFGSELGCDGKGPCLLGQPHTPLTESLVLTSQQPEEVLY